MRSARAATAKNASISLRSSYANQHLDDDVDRCDSTIRKNLATVEKLLRSGDSSDEDGKNSIGKKTTPRATTEQIRRRRQVMFDSDEEDEGLLIKRSARDSLTRSAKKVSSSPNAQSSASAHAGNQRFQRLAKLWNEDDVDSVKASVHAGLRTLTAAVPRTEYDLSSYERSNLKSVAASDRPVHKSASSQWAVQTPIHSEKFPDSSKKCVEHRKESPVSPELSSREDANLLSRSGKARTQKGDMENIMGGHNSKSTEAFQRGTAPAQTPRSQKVFMSSWSDGPHRPETTSSASHKNTTPMMQNSRRKQLSDSDSDSDDLEEIASKRARVALLSAQTTPRGLSTPQQTAYSSMREDELAVQSDKKIMDQKISVLQKEVKNLRQQMARQTAISDRQAQILAEEVAQAHEQQAYLKNVISGLANQMRGMGISPRMPSILDQKQQRDRNSILRASGMVLSADVVLDHGEEIKPLTSQDDKVFAGQAKRRSEPNIAIRRVNLEEISHNHLPLSGASDSILGIQSAADEHFDDAMNTEPNLPNLVEPIKSIRGASPTPLHLRGSSNTVKSSANDEAQVSEHLYNHAEDSENSDVQILAPLRFFQCRGTFRVRVKGVQNLPKKDNFAAWNCFASVSLGPSRKFQTDVVYNSYSARWKNTFEFDVGHSEGEILVVQIFDRDDRNQNHLVGSVKIPLQNILEDGGLGPSAPVIERTFPVMDAGNNIIRGIGNRIMVITVLINHLQEDSHQPQQQPSHPPAEDSQNKPEGNGKNQAEGNGSQYNTRREPDSHANGIQHRTKQAAVSCNTAESYAGQEMAIKTIHQKDEATSTEFQINFRETEIEDPEKTRSEKLREERPPKSGSSHGMQDSKEDVEVSLARLERSSSDLRIKQQELVNAAAAPHALEPKSELPQPAKYDTPQRSIDDDSEATETLGSVQSKIQMFGSSRRGQSASPGSTQSPARTRIAKSVSVCREPLAGMQSSNAERVGIGISFGVTVRGDFFITGMAQNGPAKACGQIRRGDKLLAVDGVAVKGMEVNDVVRAIVGKQGTSVTLDLACLPDNTTTP